MRKHRGLILLGSNVLSRRIIIDNSNRCWYSCLEKKKLFRREKRYLDVDGKRRLKVQFEFPYHEFV